MSALINAVGFAGAAGLLLAYGLLARGRLASDSRVYVWLNLGGSAGLAAASIAVGAWPSAAVNVVWLGIGLVAVLRPARPAPPAHDEPAAPQAAVDLPSTV